MYTLILTIYGKNGLNNFLFYMQFMHIISFNKLTQVFKMGDFAALYILMTQIRVSS